MFWWWCTCTVQNINVCSIKWFHLTVLSSVDQKLVLGSSYFQVHSRLCSCIEVHISWSLQSLGGASILCMGRLLLVVLMECSWFFFFFFLYIAFDPREMILWFQDMPQFQNTSNIFPQTGSSTEFFSFNSKVIWQTKHAYNACEEELPH